MTREKFLLAMEELMEMPAGTLRGDEQLDDLEQWNSMAMIGFMALADSNNHVKLVPRQIAGAGSVNDLLQMARVEEAAAA